MRRKKRIIRLGQDNDSHFKQLYHAFDEHSHFQHENDEWQHEV